MFKFTIQILVIRFLYRDTVCFINTYCFQHIDADYFQPLLIERCRVFRRSASYHSASYLPLFSELFSVPFLSFPVGELYPVLLAAFSPVFPESEILMVKVWVYIAPLWLYLLHTTALVLEELPGTSTSFLPYLKCWIQSRPESSPDFSFPLAALGIQRGITKMTDRCSLKPTEGTSFRMAVSAYKLSPEKQREKIQNLKTGSGEIRLKRVAAVVGNHLFPL